MVLLQDVGIYWNGHLNVFIRGLSAIMITIASRTAFVLIILIPNVDVNTAGRGIRILQKCRKFLLGVTLCLVVSFLSVKKEISHLKKRQKDNHKAYRGR